MKVSIITVCYNSEKTIRDTIESVLAQSYEDMQYIIVDGASSDASLDIINEYRDCIYKVISEPDKGIYDAMNKGVDMATGDIVAIINSDDFYCDDHVISEVVTAFQADAEAEAVLADVNFINPISSGNLVKRYYSSKSFKPWKLRFGIMPAHPSMFLRKSVYTKFGLYDTSFKSAADYDFIVRCFMVGSISYTYIDRLAVTMRLGGMSTSGLNSYLRTLQETSQALKNNNIYSNMFFCALKYPSKLVQCIPMYIDSKN